MHEFDSGSGSGEPGRLGHAGCVLGAAEVVAVVVAAVAGVDHVGWWQLEPAGCG